MSDMREAFDKYYASLDDDLLPYHTMLETWQAAQSVPGFVLVPVEPTSEMAEAGQDCIVGSRTSVDDVWQAMIEKAQEKKNG